jgi:hypothetical protein
MKARPLGGAISRADAIYVWVPYTEVVYEADEVVEGETVEEVEEEPEEIGHWLAVTKVQAKELVADACTSDIEDLEIMAEERGQKLYIGLGPLPE